MNIDQPIADPISRAQVDALRTNAADFGLRFFPMGSRENGIVHVIGPELGLTQPGLTIACGDSHTSTHGAFGALGVRHRHHPGARRARHPEPGWRAAQDVRRIDRHR